MRRFVPLVVSRLFLHGSFCVYAGGPIRLVLADVREISRTGPEGYYGVDSTAPFLAMGTAGQETLRTFAKWSTFNT